MFRYRLFNVATPGLTERRGQTITPPPLDESSTFDGEFYLHRLNFLLLQDSRKP